jgi:hypothetical protein
VGAAVFNSNQYLVWLTHDGQPPSFDVFGEGKERGKYNRDGLSPSGSQTKPTLVDLKQDSEDRECDKQMGVSPPYSVTVSKHQTKGTDEVAK